MRVFVAHSQPLFANALGKALMRWPQIEVVSRFETQGAATVETALREKPDIALIDYWLHGMDGPAAARRILLARPEQKIVVLCWLYGPQELKAALDAGAHAVVYSLGDVDQLVATLERVHAGERMSYGPAPAPEPEEEDPKVPPEEAPAARGEESGAWARLSRLTTREMEVLRLLASGRTVAEVAAETSTSVRTVRTHVSNILAKTDTRSQTQAVALAARSGLLVPGEVPPATSP